MLESKIKDENYYQVMGFMINRLKLKGIALQIYAIIYGFSQDGESRFTGSLQYLCDFTGASKPTIIKALQNLTEQGYINKTEHINNGVKFNEYSAILRVVKNFNGGSKETLPGVVKNFNGGSKETLPNNNIYNNIYNNNYNDNMGKRFAPPTVEEVEAYCEERNNNVDADRFVDYYSSKGWMIGKNKMKDWRAAVRTWERGSERGSENKPIDNAKLKNNSVSSIDKNDAFIPFYELENWGL